MKVRQRFFKGLKPKITMDENINPIQPEETHLDLDKPVQPADLGQIDPQAFAEEHAPAEEGHNEASKEETEQKKTEPEAPLTVKEGFNCQSCLGEGLKDEATICPNCQGTGKIS